MSKHILAGDIGGTKTNLALYRVDDCGRALQAREDSFASAGFPGLEALLREFAAAGAEPLAAAVFGVAGPVLDGRASLTNLPWKLEEAALSAALGGAAVRLVNDLAATAYGALFLSPAELCVLNEGVPRATHRAVIAAGTGLGQAVLFWDGGRFQPVATEGGHVGFAPRDEREIALLRHLQSKFGRVSWERVLSGPGLHAIFEFLTAQLGREASAEVRERMQSEDPSAVIGEVGVAGRCAACEETVDLFVGLYGAQACNLVLSTMALGGLYLGGGIVTKLLPKVQAGGFMQSFRNAGRFAKLLAETPVSVITDPKAALRGAAQTAVELAEASAGSR